MIFQKQYGKNQLTTFETEFMPFIPSGNHLLGSINRFPTLGTLRVFDGLERHSKKVHSTLFSEKQQ